MLGGLFVKKLNRRAKDDVHPKKWTEN